MCIFYIFIQRMPLAFKGHSYVCFEQFSAAFKVPFWFILMSQKRFFFVTCGGCKRSPRTFNRLCYQLYYLKEDKHVTLRPLKVIQNTLFQYFLPVLYGGNFNIPFRIDWGIVQSPKDLHPAFKIYLWR